MLAVSCASVGSEVAVVAADAVGSDSCILSFLHLSILTYLQKLLEVLYSYHWLPQNR